VASVPQLLTSQVSDTPATLDGLGRLREFRAGWYRCLGRWSDTLFEMGDALLTAPGRVRSLPYLSIEPVCRRGHGSVYAALARGSLDIEAVRDLLVDYAPAGWWPVFAVDVSAWPRPGARCSPGRGMQHVPLPASSTGTRVPGWAYQWLAQLGPGNDSWTAPMDVRRIDPADNTNDMACAQMADFAARWAARHPGVVPVFCLDAGYCPLTATIAVTGAGTAPARIIVRIRRDRVFYHRAPAKTPGTPGRPKLHGPRFACADPGTWPPPAHHLERHDNHYGHITVHAWTHLHPGPTSRRHRPAATTSGTAAPIIEGTIIRITTTRPDTPTTTPLWLWTAGDDPLDLNLIWRAYLHRFDIEHLHRYLKQHLAWTTPTIRHPHQADTWTQLIAAAHTQIRLAQPLIAAHRMPWEKPLTPTTATPLRVHRGFRRLAPTLGTPTRAPKPTHPGPGRPPGSKNQQPTPRHKVIIKGKKKKKR